MIEGTRAVLSAADDVVQHSQGGAVVTVSAPQQTQPAPPQAKTWDGAAKSRCEYCGRDLRASGMSRHLKLHCRGAKVVDAAGADGAAKVRCENCGREVRASGMSRHLKLYCRGAPVVDAAGAGSPPRGRG